MILTLFFFFLLPLSIHPHVKRMAAALSRRERLLHAGNNSNNTFSGRERRCYKKRKKNPAAALQPNNCSHLISILPGFKTENQFIFLEKGTLIEDHVRHGYFWLALLGDSKPGLLIEILTDSSKLHVIDSRLPLLRWVCKFATPPPTSSALIFLVTFEPLY